MAIDIGAQVSHERPGRVARLAAAALLVCALGAQAQAQSPYRFTALGTLGGWTSHARDINNAGQVVGYADLEFGGSRAALWDGAALTDYYHAVWWRDGGVIDLGTPGGFDSYATDINNAGQIVGQYGVSPSYGHFRAVLWNGRTAIDLNTLLRPETVAAGWVLVSANAINDDGWIVGEAYNRFQHSPYTFPAMQGYMLSISDLPDRVLHVPTIPEPSTHALMLVGLGALAFANRRRAIVPMKD